MNNELPNSFKNKVYEIVSNIPVGKVMTYGQVAKLAGSPKAARAVGMCMSTNTDTKVVPCHRVVSSNGKLTGYAFGGIISKKNLLKNEGVKFDGEKVNLSISQMHNN